MITVSDIDESQIAALDLPDEPIARVERLAILAADRTVDVHLQLQFSIEGYQLAEQLGRSDLIAQFLHNQGWCYHWLSNYSKAYELLHKAEEAYQSLGDVVNAAFAQMTRGETCVLMGEYSEAMSHLTGALETSRQLNERRLESYILTVLGILHKHLGDYESAMSSFLQGLAIDETMDDRKSIAEKLANLGWISEALDDRQGAITYYQRSQAIFRDSSAAYGETYTAHGLGDVYVTLGDYRQAIDNYMESLEIAIRIGRQDDEARALAGIGRAYLEMGELAQAHDWLHKSLDISEQADDQHEVLNTLFDIQRIFMKQGEIGKAYEHLSRAQEIALKMNAPPTIARIDLALSEYYEQTGDSARALEYFKAYHRIEADILKEDTTTKLKRARAQAELEKLEKEAALTRLKTERMEHELELAHRVQMSLLPAEPPQIAGLDIAATCIPALEVGGDYYDFFPLSAHGLGIAIGDIAGKGIPAAIQMTLVKGVIGAYVESSLSPKEVLFNVNRHVHASFSRGWFASMIYAVIDLEQMELHYASAGHNPLLLLRNGKRISPERTRGIALGLANSEAFSKAVIEYTLAIAPGDTILCYTDGFSEAMNAEREEYSDARLIESAIHHSTLPNATTMLDAIREDVSIFTGNAQRHDDMTMVVLRVE